MISFKELRDSLSPEDIIRILGEYDVKPYYDGPKYLIFPTCCHNLVGGSNKLYYYKDIHMFHCYTDCAASFDIFELIIKMEGLRGHKIGKVQAIEKTGIHISSRDKNDLAEETVSRETAYLYELNGTKAYEVDTSDLEPIPFEVLDERYVFDLNGLKTWLDEGIDLNTMLRYRITYDPIDNCVVVPQFDENGLIVGVRGRFLDPDAPAKYKPIMYNGKLLNHPKNKTLYGFAQNKEAIKMTKSVIIFEGEKSVCKLDTILDKKNISVACCGQTISREHIKLLLSCGVTNVIVAFDADYKTMKETQDKFNEYKRLATPLLPYFNVSIIMDFNHRLGYKDSPIDRGIDIFNELMKERIYI